MGRSLLPLVAIISVLSAANWATVSQATPGQIALDGTINIESARSFAVYEGSLYMGTKKVDGAEVYRYDGDTTWTKVSQTTPGQIAAGGTAGIDGVQSMIVHNDVLYVGTQEPGAAEVYRYDGGTTWTRVSQATPGQIAAGGTGSIDRVQAMVVYGGNLYIGTLEPNRAEVYRYDGGTTWTKVSHPIPGRLAPRGLRKINGVDAMVVHSRLLFVGTSEPDRAEVYQYDGMAWAKVSQPIPGQIALGGTSGINIVESLTVYNDSLYLGTQEPGAAEVYRYDGGTTWSKVSQPIPGQIAAGGTNSIDSAQWLVAYDANLYLGTGKTDAGEFYRYHGGTTWTKVSQAMAGQLAPGGTTDINVAAVGSAVYGDILYLGTDELNRAEVYSYADTP